MLNVLKISNEFIYTMKRNSFFVSVFLLLRIHWTYKQQVEAIDHFPGVSVNRGFVTMGECHKGICDNSNASLFHKKILIYFPLYNYIFYQVRFVFHNFS